MHGGGRSVGQRFASDFVPIIVEFASLQNNSKWNRAEMANFILPTAEGAEDAKKRYLLAKTVESLRGILGAHGVLGSFLATNRFARFREFGGYKNQRKKAIMNSDGILHE
jgi:hypothetical protein